MSCGPSSTTSSTSCPTILDAAGIAEPDVVNGIEQKPIEGVSMRYSFDDAAAPSRRTTQYFEILGNRAIYHDGWVAACFHGRAAVGPVAGRRRSATSERWELYRIGDDFSQGRDLAAEHPDKLRELQALFDREARAYDVYPLSDQTTHAGAARTTGPACSRAGRSSRCTATTSGSPSWPR